MNKIQLTINIVLATAVVVSLALSAFSLSDKEQSTVNTQVAAVEGQLPIAYLNLDSLLTQYTFAIEANEKLMSKQEDARLKLNTRANNLQKDMADFQHKLENNAFLSRERAEAAQQKIIKKQQDLQELEAKLTQDIMVENQALNIQLRDTLDNYLKEFNADGRYQIIFANTASDNVLIAQPGHDITAEVVAALNARYSK